MNSSPTPSLSTETAGSAGQGRQAWADRRRLREPKAEADSYFTVRAASRRDKEMETDMTLKTFMTSTLAAGLIGGAAFAGVDRITEIDVTADLSAIQNADAAAYWGELETDLEAAIASRVTDRLTDEEGARIVVDVRELELASAFERAVTMADAVLVGQVNVIDDTDNANYDGYELSVSLDSARFIVPEGQTIIFNADDRSSYDALVNAFAAGVVERLK